MDQVSVFFSACLPPAFLAAALFFTRKRTISVRLAWAAFWLTVSLPLGIASLLEPMLVLTYDGQHEHNPGAGLIAGFIVMSWIACAGLLVAAAGAALALKYTRGIGARLRHRA